METEYASKGVGTAGLTTGIIGTVLGGLATAAAHGGFGGLIGGRAAEAANDVAVLEMARKDAEIAQLKADAATDKKLVEVYTTLRAQDKEQDGKISSLNTRLTALETAAPLREQIVLGQVQSVATAVAGIQNTLSGITKCVVPNTSVCPGWGDVTIKPVA